jgi:ACS family sodium-dependent inorganic phosphate cotransporter-like MFS transporter 5
MFVYLGIMGALSSILFYFLMAESPKNQKMISKREAYFLQEATKQNQTQNQKKNLKTPWFNLFSSKICLAIYTTLFCYTWGSYLFLTQLPTYMRDVLKVITILNLKQDKIILLY